MTKYLISILTLVFLTAAAKAQEEGGYESPPPPKKYDGITQSMSLSPPNNLAPPIGQYKSMGWGGAGTLSPRGVIDEWEEYHQQ